MGRAWRLARALLALSVVAACSSATAPEQSGTPADSRPPATRPADTDGTQTAAASGDPITIAASLPLTGMFSLSGSKHRDGYQLCVDLINDAGGLSERPLEMLISDNRSDTQTAVNQYQRFINADQADLLFATFSSLLTFPTSGIAEQAGMLYVSPSDGSVASFSRGFRYLFDIQQSARQFIGETPVDALVDYRDAGVIPADEFPRTAAVVHADDFFANVIASGVLGQEVEIPGSSEVVDLSPGFLEEAGIEVVLDETWPADFNDWIGLAGSIRASGADLLMVLAAGEPDAVNLLRALQTVGFNPAGMYVTTGTDTEFQEQLGSAADGIMVHTAWHPAAEWEGVFLGENFSNHDFIAAFQERFGRTPDEDEAIPFAVCQTLEQAIRDTGSIDNDALREWLATRNEDDPARTILGDLHWDDRGLVVGRHFLLTQWQDGELEFVYPTDEFPGVVDLLWPKPEP